MACYKRLILKLKCRPGTVIAFVFILLVAMFFFWDTYYIATFFQHSYPVISSAEKWIRLDNNVNIFSAFYDDRKFRSRPVVVVLGLEKQDDRLMRYNCIFAYKNGIKYHLKSNSPLYVLTRVHWLDGFDQQGKKILNYRPFFHSCSLPSHEIPNLVTITAQKNSTIDIAGAESDKFILVKNMKQVYQVSFGVCISSPIFNIDNPIQLIETFEMNKLLGAEFFVVYLYHVSLKTKSRKILEKYENDGLVEVVQNWGKNFPGHAHYYGQLLSITDCLYRNMYRCKYLVYTDLDEIIMPLRHPDWSSLIKNLDGPNIGSFTFNMVYLRAVKSSVMTTLVCPSGEFIHFQTPRYITFKNRSNTGGSLSRRRTKYITKTNVSLIAQIHYVEKLVSGYHKVDVPVDNALVYHYRVPYQFSNQINSWVMDRVMERYLTRFTKAMQRVLCDL